MKKEYSSKNKTINLDEEEVSYLKKSLLVPSKNLTPKDIINKTIIGDFFKVASFLPANFVDLLIIDPPYNLNKNFNKSKFLKLNISEYKNYVESFIKLLIPTLKKNASIYVCSDIFSSYAIYEVLNKYFSIKNRITWAREKGRGAKENWKNSIEDIWFATNGERYYFDLEAVKIKRKVLAPYKENGKAKDWYSTEEGNFRLTCPSNFWDDITIPYWSMPENTEHPTQKPEKLIAKLILASSKKGDVILDPFAGSGTTSVVASKLERNHVAIERDEYYACLIEKRLIMAKENKRIQGFEDGIFLERNLSMKQRKDTTEKLVKKKDNL